MNDQHVNAAELRQRAEETIQAKARSSENSEAMPPEETRRTLHELRVHRVELEMQNEELRQAQAELGAARARYFDLYDLAPVGYCTIGEQGLILETNLTAATLLGMARGALVKQPISRFILKEDHAIYHHRRKQVFGTGEPQAWELRMLKMDGTPFWGHLAATAATSADGAPMCRLVIVDISERKRSEEEKAKLEIQFQQAQKMESVGRLAGGVAHDFNNILQVILIHADLLLKNNLTDSSSREGLEEIHSCARRSADLTRQLLAFARRQTIAPKVLDLNAAVEDLLKMMRRLIGEDIDIAWLPAADLGPVNMDPCQIDQILANLCVNARDAIGGVGKVTIETENVYFDDAYCADHPGFAPGEYVRLAVSDNGCGMDKETQRHIFEPFFTTKIPGKGTGLGLATIYGIVQQNHGFLHVYSEPGHGTTFKIFLPRHGGQTSAILAARPTEPPRSCGETVLLVEDEPTILAIARKVLEWLGYTVLCAKTPGEAIRLAGERPGAIHLLMTDVVMPEMNGRDLAKLLLADNPRIKCLFMSGYTSDVIAHHGVLDEGVHFIPKPFSMGDLAAKVRETLDRR
jgi:PAS domain S-box-containing protein